MPISYTHRLIIWSFVYNKTLEKPILGYGIGNSRFVPVAQSDMVQYNRNDSTEEKRTLLSPLPLHPHNNIMQVFIELGALGLLLMSVYMWNILKKVKNIASEKQDIIWHAAATSMIINYFCIGMISFNMWQSWWMLIMFLGILILNIKVTFGHYNTISK
jgi:O-antigen ligase